MTNKIVGIDTKQKPVDSSCQFCGAEPACPGLTCPRLKAVELFDDGATLAVVEFFEPEVWKTK